MHIWQAIKMQIIRIHIFVEHGFIAALLHKAAKCKIPSV